MGRSLFDRNYLLLTTSNFLFSLYQTIFIFLPAFLYTLHVREGEIGLIMATGTLVSVILKPVNGWLVDRGNRVAFLVAGALLAALSTLPWLRIGGTGPWLYAVRILQGASYSFFATAAYGFIAAIAPPDRRGEALGVFGLSFFLPTAIGGLLGERLVDASGFPALFLAAAGAAFLSALFPLGLVERRDDGAVSFASLSGFLSRPYLVPCVAALLFGVAYGTIFTFLPVFLMVKRVPSLGVFVLAYSLAVVATRTAGRRMADRFPRERVGLVSLLLLAGGNLAIPFLAGQATLVLVGVLTGLGHGFLFPSLSALLLDRAGSGRAGVSMALYTGAFDLGAVVGAGTFGFVAQQWGYPVMFFSAALLTAAGALVFAVLDPAFAGKR